MFSDDFVPVSGAIGSASLDPWIAFGEGFGVLIASGVCVECAEDSVWFPCFDPARKAWRCACGGCEDGCAFRGLLESECGEGVEGALCEEEGIGGQVCCGDPEGTACLSGAFCHGLEGFLVCWVVGSEDFGAGGLAPGVGASEDGVVALVGVEDSVSLASVEDAVGDAAGCVEAISDGWPVLFARGWHVDGFVLRHEGCGGLGEGAVSCEHDEIEGACAAGSCSVIEEAGSVDGEDGSGPAPSGPVAGVLAVSESARDGFEGLAADGVELLLGPSSCHGVPLRAVWGRGSWCGVWGWGVFPVSRFPSPPGAFGRKRFEVSAELVSLRGLHGLSGAEEFAQCVADGLGAHSSGVSDLAVREGLSGLGEDGLDALARVVRVRRGGWGLRFGDLQGGSLWQGCDLELEIVQVGSGAVVGGEQDALLAPAQDENVIGPREQLGTSPQGLSGAGAAVLAGVMDEQDGGVAAALQLAQAVEDGCDLAHGVLVGAMQADQGVEDEQARPDPLDGVGETLLVGGFIEAEGGDVDDVEVEAGEGGATGGCDALETLAEDVGSIFGGEQQHGACLDREAAQAGDAGGDGDGDVQGEEGFAALGLAADDADALLVPERLDEPGLLCGAGLEFGRGAGGEVVHVRVPRRWTAWG